MKSDTIFRIESVLEFVLIIIAIPLLLTGCWLELLITIIAMVSIFCLSAMLARIAPQEKTPGNPEGKPFSKMTEEEKETDRLYEAQMKREAIMSGNHPVQPAYHAPTIQRCPTCGSTDVTKLSNIDRAASVAVWGLASKKMGKQLKCNSCGYMW